MSAWPSVEVVELSGTAGRDGQWLRVRYRGYYVADVRSPAELAQWLDVADLEPDGLSGASASPAGEFAAA